MNRPPLAWFAVLWVLLALLPTTAPAHIGNLTTIHEGTAGPFPVRVSVRTPTVVPGLAEVSVRVLTNGPLRVTALPAHSLSGPEGRPPPDLCRPVPGETNLYHAQLWLMVRGTYGIEVEVEGSAGRGRLIVPVHALATTTLPMTPGLGALLAGLGLLLVAAAVAKIGRAHV